jgi:hypothetical protein
MTPQVEEIVTLKGMSITDLDKEMNEYIQLGYIPYGNIVESKTGYSYVQQVVKLAGVGMRKRAEVAKKN